MNLHLRGHVFNYFQGFGIEFLITFILVLVVFGAAADDNNTPNVKGTIHKLRRQKGQTDHSPQDNSYQRL